MLFPAYVLSEGMDHTPSTEVENIGVWVDVSSILVPVQDVLGFTVFLSWSNDTNTR